MDWLTSACLYLIRLTLPGLRGDARAFAEALVAEAEQVPEGKQRLLWLIGGLRFVLSARFGPKAFAYLVTLSACFVALIALDRAIDNENAKFYVLGLLVVSAGALGAATSERAWIPGVVLGAALGLNGLVTKAEGGVVPDQGRHTPFGAVVFLFIFIVPGALASEAGAAGRRLKERRRVAAIATEGRDDQD